MQPGRTPGRGLRLGAVVGLSLLAGAAVAAAADGPRTDGAPAARTLLVGAAEDVGRDGNGRSARDDLLLLRSAGLRAVRVTSVWAPRQTEPSSSELAALQGVASAAAPLGVRVFVTVMHAGSRTTPLTASDQADFAAYAAALVRAVPAFDDLIVANEPNLNRFWLPQYAPDGTDAAAPAYLSLLAATYDAVKAADPGARVWGGALAPRGSDRPGTSRDTHSPTVFLRDLGAAYRASGRTVPVMDGLATHPYADSSSQSPDFAHPNSTTIGVADYGKLVALLGAAFDGTAQPGSRLPIVYDEFGVETTVPPEKAASYTGSEPAATRPVDEATQARFYRRAMELAYCQPTVEALLLFHVVDESALPAWQSGVFYADRTSKASLAGVFEAAARTAGGSVARCPGLAIPVAALTLRWPSAAETARGVRKVRLRCDVDCLVEARLVRVPSGSTTLIARTSGNARSPIVVDLGGRRIARRSYRYTLSLVHPVNAASPTLLQGPVFTGG